MKKFFVLAIIFFSVQLYSQNAGNTGLSFLKFGFGARNTAMGDVGNSASNDLTALYYNPARLSNTQKNEVIFTHNSWIQDVSSEMFGIKTFLFELPVAIGFNVTNISDIEVRQIPGEPISKFDANYFYGSISTAYKIDEMISVGASLKYFYEGLLNDESTGFGFDLGAFYKLPVEGLSVSAAVRNLGSMNELRNEATKLPSELRVGPAYNFKIEDYKLNVTAAGEYQKYFDADDHLNFGLEVLYDNLIAVRGGYQTNYESRDLTAGIGLMWGNLKFDYSYIPFSLGVGSANLFSLGFKF
ncbi:MAG: PorV/PorQ family protein [Ignavibacterium sp.]|nr:PorV/PorQ family protein [Ignavibacterium sp.]